MSASSQTSPPESPRNPARFSIDLLISAALTLLLIGAFSLYSYWEKQSDRANRTRHASLLLADELRQSGDDLTRMVRTYVATGNPAYKQYFQEILDIRDGKKPRPRDYWRPYWDLRLAGELPPRSSSAAPIPLLELMRQAGFTEAEFQLLAQAKANSDALTIPEIEAIRLIDSGGQEAETNRSRALAMLFDGNYHRAKISVMKPIHDFLRAVDERTEGTVSHAEHRATLAKSLFLALGVGLMFVVWRLYGALQSTLGGSLGEVQLHMTRLGSGDFSNAIPVNENRKSSIMEWLAALREKLEQSDRLRRDSEAARNLLAAIVESSADAVIGQNLLRGTVTSWNPSAEKMFGYTATEVIGQPFSRLVPAAQSTEEDSILKQVAAGERVESFDTVRVRKDGTLIDVSLMISPIHDGQGAIVGASYFIRDIRERKQAEEALRKSEQEFRALAESVPQIVWATRADGFNIYFNQHWVDYTGLSLEESYGHGWNKPFHPSDQQRAWDAWQAATTKLAEYSLECRLRRADGEYRWWLVRGVPMRNATGTIAKWFGTCTDVHDLKVAEERNRLLNVELEDLVQHRTTELEISNRELESFAYSVSHDLRSPLRGIDGWSHAALEDYGDRLEGKGRDYLEQVCAEAQRMGELIDSLLHLSRVTRTEMKRETVDLTGLAELIIANLRKQDDRRKVQAVVAPGLTATGDPMLLRLGLENLLGNAWKFTSRREEALIEFGLEAGEPGRPGAHFFVRDNGAGFNMAHAAKLFAPFQRLHRSSEFEGSGIGLATIQRIIHRHGGQIWAQAETNKGAAFFFTLPTDGTNHE